MTRSVDSETNINRTYAHQFTELLASLGYTHCFLLPGGAIMHLVNAARNTMTCIPVVHEVSAVIGAEYFNQVSASGRAYALVTAGPGVTNSMTGMAGAFLESRDVLVVAGQVKSADLARGVVRQRGIQELDGLSMAQPVSVAARRIEQPIPDLEAAEVVRTGLTNRAGPVYLEFCLDAQGAPSSGQPEVGQPAVPMVEEQFRSAADLAIPEILAAISRAQRPVILVGGGVTYETAKLAGDGLARSRLPLMTTWNGFDRVADDHPGFAGRPNTWGQRSANVILAQSDCIVALGTRLGIQQTGFNWNEWGPEAGTGVVIQVDVDSAELDKGHPRVDLKFQADANRVLLGIAEHETPRFDAWWEHIALVQSLLPAVDPANQSRPQYLSPYELCQQLSAELSPEDIVIPASSGSGQFVPMETLSIPTGTRVLTNKGLASMGYGLAGAIGAAAASDRRTILIEGDGSFSQNIQELGTLALHGWPVKIFLLDNDGYASIRTTQQNYFGGAYLGCDSSTGLGFPNWTMLAEAFGIPTTRVGPRGLNDENVRRLLATDGPALFVVAVDPEQTYFPKVTSRVTESGTMESNPTHLMTPALDPALMRQVFAYRLAEDE